MPGRVRDLTGKKFGLLIVTGDSGERNSQKRILWDCQCDCGKTTLKSSKQLKDVEHPSCGCMDGRKGHGKTNDPAYIAWTHIKGDRDPEWDEFTTFYQYMGDKPEGSQLLKFDDLLPHGPENSYYRTKGGKRQYPDIPWMYVDFSKLDGIYKQTVGAGKRAA